MTWFAVPREQFLLESGQELSRFQSSDHGTRSFCGRCGSTLFCESTHHPDKIDIVLANMDGPIDRSPQAHVYFDDRAEWITTNDGLPRLGGATGLEAITPGSAQQLFSGSRLPAWPTRVVIPSGGPRRSAAHGGREVQQMSSDPRDGAAVRVPPPLTYLVAVVAGIGLQFVSPLSIGLAGSIRAALALVVALLGLALLAGAMRLFRATDQDPKPWVATPEIISTGVYRFTRNPMYVGVGLLQAAIGIGLGNPWILLLAPVACVVVQFTAIRHEEAYLERKFGDAYRDYKKTVRRWV